VRKLDGYGIETLFRALRISFHAREANCYKEADGRSQMSGPANAADSNADVRVELATRGSSKGEVWRFNLRTVRTWLLVFGGYYLGAKVGFALTFQPHPVSVMWPPNSILLAALLLSP